MTSGLRGLIAAMALVAMTLAAMALASCSAQSLRRRRMLIPRSPCIFFVPFPPGGAVDIVGAHAGR